MAKRGFTIDFGFIPVPEEAPDADPPLLQCEWQLLTYLLKQVRFGEELPAVSDDELIHGILDEKGRRKDQGCRLSRNSLKTARQGLVDRGWLEAKNTSSDPTRPRWMYRLVTAKRNRKPSGESDTADEVKDQQLVSKFDSVTDGRQLSNSESAVSKIDCAGVTSRQPVSKVDTCNKEDRKTKNLNKELEAPGDERPISASVLAIAQRTFWTMFESLPKRTDFDPDKDKMTRIRIAAVKSGLPLGEVKTMLRQLPEWHDWKYLELIDSQAEIDFPSSPAKQPESTWKKLQREYRGGQA